MRRREDGGGEDAGSGHVPGIRSPARPRSLIGSPRTRAYPAHGPHRTHRPRHRRQPRHRPRRHRGARRPPARPRARRRARPRRASRRSPPPPARRPRSCPCARPLLAASRSTQCVAALARAEIDVARQQRRAVRPAGCSRSRTSTQIYAMLQVNLVAVMHLTQRLLPGMLERGRGTDRQQRVDRRLRLHARASRPTRPRRPAWSRFSEALRRELHEHRRRRLHVVTPGVNTDMLDETDEQYGRYADTSSWDRVEPARVGGEDRRRDASPTTTSSGRAARPRWRSSPRAGRRRCSTPPAARMFSRQPRSS